MNTAVLTAEKTVTLPRWLWTAIGLFALMLAGTAVTAVGSLVSNQSDHESRLSAIESSAVTQRQVVEMFRDVRQDIRADISSVRDEIRGLRQELRQ